MSTEDAREFGPVVEHLVGRECERTLATNTLKLRFGTERDPRGDAYVWIDPPWQLQQNGALVASSDDYRDDTFRGWSKLLDPLNHVRLTGWSVGDTETIFTFANGYRVVVPDGDGVRKDDDWYAHWYARITDRAATGTV